MNNRKSFIVGIKSTKLTTKEKIFLKNYKPWGVILFTRNIKNIKQTLKLTSSIRKNAHIEQIDLKNCGIDLEGATCWQEIMEDIS